MKINIFKIPKENIADLKEKIRKLDMQNKYIGTKDGWRCSFYLSTNPEVKDIAWVKDFETTVSGLADLKNVIHYAIYLCSKGDNHFALTYGKSHFYIRKFCDADFGLEMAKRIANEDDVKQKASKLFSGRKKKEIKSFVKDTRLDSESGESVDYISAGIIPDKREDFGEKSKFGTSFIVSKEDLTIDKIPDILDAALSVLTKESPRFDLPKTVEIKDPNRISGYVVALLGQIKKDISSIETEDNSYDLVGTDFIFYSNEKYSFHLGRKKSEQFSDLSHRYLKNFIDVNNIQDGDILRIKVEISNDNGKTYTKSLCEMIEYTVPNENIVLEGGKWKQFNKEYVEQINDSVDSISIDETETQFKKIFCGEPEFNDSNDVKEAGYEKSDTDFSKIKIATGYKVEAWDLRKAETVYAVKFGGSQKLVYVCSQAMTTLDIIRNNASLKKINDPPRRFCLWLGFKRIHIPKKISEIKSIILKQHVDMFAHKCRGIGMEPVLKFSQHERRTEKTA